MTAEEKKNAWTLTKKNQNRKNPKCQHENSNRTNTGTRPYVHPSRSQRPHGNLCLIKPLNRNRFDPVASHRPLEPPIVLRSLPSSSEASLPVFLRAFWRLYRPGRASVGHVRRAFLLSWDSPLWEVPQDNVFGTGRLVGAFPRPRLR